MNEAHYSIDHWYLTLSDNGTFSEQRRRQKKKEAFDVWRFVTSERSS